MLRDRLPAMQDSFIPKTAKAQGITNGYIATEKETGDTFILKQFYKSIAKLPKEIAYDPDAFGRVLNDRDDGMTELLGSTLYQLLLYNRAPKEALVLPDQNNSDSLYVRSKFFANAVTLSSFTKGIHGWDVLSDKVLRQVEGFEKAIAACHMLGESDYHAGNLMVQNGTTIVKIDNGKSFVENYEDFGTMVNKTYNSFSSHGYAKAIADGNLPFSIEKYSQALNQMLSQYDEKQMEAAVDQKFAELEKAGFDLKGLSDLGYNGLKEFYKKKVRQNVANMRGIAKSAEIVTKFSNVSPEFKSGGWLEDFAKSPIKDPVAYAAHNNIQIEGQNALEWAYNNRYKIKITETTSLDPMEYIANEKKKLSLPLSKSEVEFVVRAEELGFTNAKGKGMKVILEEANIALHPEKQIITRMQLQEQAAMMALTSLVDKFVAETTNGQVTEKK